MQEQLQNWYQLNKRNLPWRNTNDAYTIWLSEIILQQTRVEQGLPYFNNFLNAFATVNDFANADLNAILKLWQGLGYYSRARNMHATAIIIRDEHNGIFPNKYADLLKLKGIGPYTAAAIASFSNNEAQAVVDGNVYRVIARYAGIYTDTNSTEGKKEFTALANELLDKQNAALHNQAMMELGALVCKPQNPDCINCPINSTCYAFETKNQTQLPVKVKKIKTKTRFFNYAIIKYQNSTFLKQRGSKDIWQGLFEFPMIEADKLLNEAEILLALNKAGMVMNDKVPAIKWVGNDKHLLTHQTIYANFFEIICDKLPSLPAPYFMIDLNELKNFAIPRLLDKLISNDKLQQSLF